METPARYIPKQRIGPFVESVFMGPESDDTRLGVQINASTPSSLLARGSARIGHDTRTPPNGPTKTTHTPMVVRFLLPTPNRELIGHLDEGCVVPAGGSDRRTDGGE